MGNRTLPKSAAAGDLAQVGRDVARPHLLLSLGSFGSTLWFGLGRSAPPKQMLLGDGRSNKTDYLCWAFGHTREDPRCWNESTFEEVSADDIPRRKALGIARCLHLSTSDHLFPPYQRGFEAKSGLGPAPGFVLFF